ncbi:MAG: hypothetical protein GC165_16505 [Armatimonadetes bacterium]|nr:hypothetical protein [Armatimonadota bacterium]MBS1725268.1 hypothetical protein [Armatimonadota bacterium]
MKTYQQFILFSFAATVLACGGGGSTITADNLKYASPVLIAGTDTGDVHSVSSDGFLVGFVTNSSNQGVGVYWASPTAAPTQVPGTLSVNFTNDKHQMLTSVSSGIPFFYDSPTSTGTQVFLQGAWIMNMNDRGEIVTVNVDYSTSTPTYTGGYFSDENGNWTLLANLPSGAPILPYYLDDSGRIAGPQMETTGVVGSGTWATSASNVSVVAKPGSNSHWSVTGMNRKTGELLMVQVYDTNSTGALSCGIYEPSTGTVDSLPGVGAKPTVVSQSGIIGGTSSPSHTTAYVWPNRNSGPIDLNTLVPAGTSVVFDNVRFVLANGDVIAHGPGGLYYLKRL